MFRGRAYAVPDSVAMATVDNQLSLLCTTLLYRSTRLCDVCLRSLSPDPRQRVNVWIMTVATAFHWLNVFSFQPSLMRYRAVGSEKKANQ